jgi:uncharacterized protein
MTKSASEGITGTIAARRGHGLRLAQGRSLRVINTHGSQVLDTWAFRDGDMREYMCMEHTRSLNSRWTIAVGSRLVSTRRRPMLTVVEDTSPGAHDTLLCACSPEIYAELGCTSYHDNCEDNLHAALRAMALQAPCTPPPLNLFMNVDALNDGTVLRAPPSSRPGDSIVLRAEMNVVVVFSACPQDITPINGLMRRPTDAHYAVF